MFRTKRASLRRGGSAAVFARWARRLAFAAPLVGLATANAAETGGGDALRGLAQAEKDAGRLSHYRAVEAYRALGVTMAPAAARAAPAAEAEAARDWAERFCVRSSRDFHWDHRWKVIVYAYGQPQRAFACAIPTTAARSAHWPEVGAPVACNDWACPTLEPVNEAD